MKAEQNRYVVGRGSLSLSPGRGTVGEPTPVGTSVILASCHGWVWLSPGLSPLPSAKCGCSASPPNQVLRISVSIPGAASSSPLAQSQPRDADTSPAGGGSGCIIPVHPCVPSAEHVLLAGCLPGGLSATPPPNIWGGDDAELP